MAYVAEICSKAFQARRFTAPIEKRIEKHFHVIRNENDIVLSPGQLVERAKGASVLLVTTTECIDTDVVESLYPELSAIATLSVGFDHIDVSTATKRGIHVLTTPDVLSDACAEVAMMLLLNAARRGFEADQLVRSGAWSGWAPTQLLGHGLVGRRAGIFGMGRIGWAVAARCRAFGMDIHYHNRRKLAPSMERGSIFHQTLDSLLSVSDALIICVPGAAELTGVINAERLGLMPRNAIVVNIARGAIINDHALISALTTGQVFAAGLDVFDGEPAIDPRYQSLPNVFLSPHIGSATHETRNAMGNLLIDGLLDIAGGRRPANQIN